jgi:hypothetical protein
MLVRGRGGFDGPGFGGADRRPAREAEVANRLAINVIMSALGERQQQARRYEMLRDRAGFLCLTGGIGIAALVGLRNLTPEVRHAVAALVLAIGTLGALIALKYSERTRAHQRVADALRHRAEMICRDRLGFDIGTLVAEVEAEHRAAEPLHRLRIDILWIGVCLAIAAFGVALFFLRPDGAASIATGT